jgi:hypothetical protein
MSYPWVKFNDGEVATAETACGCTACVFTDRIVGRKFRHNPAIPMYTCPDHIIPGPAYAWTNTISFWAGHREPPHRLVKSARRRA